MIIRDSERSKIIQRATRERKTQDKFMTIRINSELLERFKNACGGGVYQSKIKELMIEYIDRVERVYKDEEERNLRAKRV